MPELKVVVYLYTVNNQSFSYQWLNTTDTTIRYYDINKGDWMIISYDYAVINNKEIYIYGSGDTDLVVAIPNYIMKQRIGQIGIRGSYPQYAYIYECTTAHRMSIQNYRGDFGLSFVIVSWA